MPNYRSNDQFLPILRIELIFHTWKKTEDKTLSILRTQMRPPGFEPGIGGSGGLRN